MLAALIALSGCARPHPTDTPDACGDVSGDDEVAMLACLPFDGEVPAIHDMAVLDDGALCLVGGAWRDDVLDGGAAAFVLRTDRSGVPDPAFGDAGRLDPGGALPLYASPRADGGCWVVRPRRTAARRGARADRLRRSPRPRPPHSGRHGRRGLRLRRGLVALAGWRTRRGAHGHRHARRWRARDRRGPEQRRAGGAGRRPVTAVPPIAAEYVALGDSYSAARPTPPRSPRSGPRPASSRCRSGATTSGSSSCSPRAWPPATRARRAATGTRPPGSTSRRRASTRRCRRSRGRDPRDPRARAGRDGLRGRVP
jgi:hypothetical protein